MKLIKINSDHCIIVDDSEIKEGDYYLFTWGGEQEIQRFFKEQYADRENHKHLYDNACKKITHSTQPLERMNHGNYSSNVYLDIEKLSLQEVKELIGEVDVEKKAEEFSKKIKNDDDAIDYGFIEGYNQCLEDNKDKKYTEDHLREALSQAFMAAQEGYNITSDEIIQSLQPKTEWEVQIVDDKLKLK